jgi:uncharacterized low-complexity protein
MIHAVAWVIVYGVVSAETEKVVEFFPSFYASHERKVAGGRCGRGRCGTERVASSPSVPG